MTRPTDPVPLPAVSFGTSPRQADELAALVASGTKQATTSVLAAYRAEAEPVPAVGDVAVVVDGSGLAVCTIRTTSVEVRRYADVDAEHAHAEGEGDRTLSHWRRAHERFLADVCAELDVPFDDDLELVLERFARIVST